MPPKKRNTWNEYQKNCTQGTKKATREIAKEYKERKEKCNDLLVSCGTVYAPRQAAELQKQAAEVKGRLSGIKGHLNAVRTAIAVRHRFTLSVIRTPDTTLRSSSRPGAGLFRELFAIVPVVPDSSSLCSSSRYDLMCML